MSSGYCFLGRNFIPGPFIWGNILTQDRLGDGLYAEESSSNSTNKHYFFKSTISKIVKSANHLFQMNNLEEWGSKPSPFFRGIGWGGGGGGGGGRGGGEGGEGLWSRNV